MDSATSTSRERDSGQFLNLEEFARKAWGDHGVELTFCRIEGKRWSFLAGGGHELLAASEQIALTEGIGVSVEGLGTLAPSVRTQLLRQALVLIQRLQASGMW